MREGLANPALEGVPFRGRTALVLLEMQNGLVGEESVQPVLADAARVTAVIANSVRLVNATPSRWVRVIHSTAENVPRGFGANRNAWLFARARDAEQRMRLARHQWSPFCQISFKTAT